MRPLRSRSLRRFSSSGEATALATLLETSSAEDRLRLEQVSAEVSLIRYLLPGPTQQLGLGHWRYLARTPDRSERLTRLLYWYDQFQSSPAAYNLTPSHLLSRLIINLHAGRRTQAVEARCRHAESSQRPRVIIDLGALEHLRVSSSRVERRQKSLNAVFDAWQQNRASAAPIHLCLSGLDRSRPWLRELGTSTLFRLLDGDEETHMGMDTRPEPYQRFLDPARTVVISPAGPEALQSLDEELDYVVDGMVYRPKDTRHGGHLAFLHAAKGWRCARLPLEKFLPGFDFTTPSPATQVAILASVFLHGDWERAGRAELASLRPRLDTEWDVDSWAKRRAGEADAERAKESRERLFNFLLEALDEALPQ